MHKDIIEKKQRKWLYNSCVRLIITVKINGKRMLKCQNCYIHYS
ncbi:MAG: hypothetical protein K940chlam5_01266 [Candidatus Anoxychlamydiales bacterium]|nr:hypothetical protein [Candidatus Anoxychlamydiales bacterium]